MKRRTGLIIQLIVKKWWIVMSVAVLASFVLILFMGKGNDVWFDENYSIILAKQPIGELLRLTGVDAHPPIFYLLLKVWGSIFGWSELALRSMSALLAAATVGIVALLIRRLFTTRVALVSLPFLVFAPFWLRYGYEIRMYALAGLIGALASLVLVKAVEAKTDKRWWGLYALLVAAGMYTLYMTAVVWLSHFVWLLIQKRRRFWRQPWFWSFGLAGILFLPYLPTVIFQLTHSALPGIGIVLNLTHIWEVISMVLIYTPEWSINSWTAVGVIGAVGLTIYLLDRSRHQMTGKARRSLSFLLCLALVPPVFFILISLPMSEPFFVQRYLAHTILYVYSLIGVAIALGWYYGYRKASGVLFVLMLAMLGWGLGQLVQAGNFNYERMQRPQTTEVRKLVDCQKSVVVADDPYTYINDLYYFNGCDLRFYSSQPVWYWGGYAWLADHGTRVAASTDLTASRIVHLYWNDNPNSFHPDTRYRLVSSVTWDHQVTDTYELAVH
jgi:mannosyltransferase